jgi:hypothetical protein
MITPLMFLQFSTAFKMQVADTTCPQFQQYSFVPLDYLVVRGHIVRFPRLPQPHGLFVSMLCNACVSDHKARKEILSSRKHLFIWRSEKKECLSTHAFGGNSNESKITPIHIRYSVTYPI